MKNMKKTWIAAILLAVVMIGCMVRGAMAEGNEGTEAPLYQTGLNEEDYIGTWKLYSMSMQGWPMTHEQVLQLGLHAIVVVKTGEIGFSATTKSAANDEIIRTFETTFEDGLVRFTIGGEPMVAYITPEGLLHVDLEALTFTGTTEDEKSPFVGGGEIKFSDWNLDESVLTQYFEKVVEE